MSDKVRVSADVPQELEHWFAREAAKSGAPRSALIALAMLEYKVKKESEK